MIGSATYVYLTIALDISCTQAFLFYVNSVLEIHYIVEWVSSLGTPISPTHGPLFYFSWITPFPKTCPFIYLHFMRVMLKWSWCWVILKSSLHIILHFSEIYEKTSIMRKMLHQLLHLNYVSGGLQKIGAEGENGDIPFVITLTLNFISIIMWWVTTTQINVNTCM